MDDIAKLLNLPSPEELQKQKEQFYKDAKNNPNAFTAWSQSLCSRFCSPKSFFVPLPFDRFEWLGSDHYEDAAIEEFGHWLLSIVQKKAAELGMNYPLFMKGSTFSNKFDFAGCIVPNGITQKDFGHHALNIFYAALCCDHFESGFVFREFIDPDNNLEKIYNGMPLHTEFRAFYDFDRHQVIGIFPYWEKETMNKGLYREDDRNQFSKALPRLERDYAKFKDAVVDLVTAQLKDFPGYPVDHAATVWSMDFLLDCNNRIWFIDAAEGPLSAYWDRIGVKEKWVKGSRPFTDADIIDLSPESREGDIIWIYVPMSGNASEIFGENAVPEKGGNLGVYAKYNIRTKELKNVLDVDVINPNSTLYFLYALSEEELKIFKKALSDLDLSEFLQD